jgi:hypothetical protein
MTSINQPAPARSAARTGDGTRGGEGTPVEDLARDDAAAEPRTALADQLLVGEQVLQSARMVGDEQDAAVWQVNRQAWIDSATAAVHAVFPESLEEFQLACHATTRGRWRAVFEAEARAIEAGLEMISSLLGALGPRK